ncbi:MAG TPA: response regulator, partial [Vicinamibacterales bacterium]|jgi:DNA-binding response OmpR family regulator
MPKKVLVVEDDRSARTGLLQLLAGEGYVALGASSFEEGRQLLRAERPDLLIADVRLGEFNGLQLIIGQEAPPRTIVVTGYADPVLEADARRAGAYYLLKPLDIGKLLTIVHAELEHLDATQQPQRRWARKPIAGGLAAQIDSTSARVLDISYGGLRLNLSATDNPLPQSFDVKLPQDELSVPVELIWQSRTDDGGLECGVALSVMSHSAMSAWHGLVDAIG